MKWFRSNVRLGSRLALFALAIQFVLSFGHFHGGSAQATSASGHHHGIGVAAVHLDALDQASPPSASGLVRSKTSDHGPAGQPTDDCAICAAMALVNAMVVATPPYLLAPQMAIFSYFAADAGFVDPSSARVAFQPRGPPIA